MTTESKNSHSEEKQPNPSILLDEKSSEVLNDHSKNFIKLDIGYLAAAGAIFTALKITRPELVEVGATVAPAVYSFCFILYLDIISYESTLKNLISARNGSKENRLSKPKLILIHNQAYIHAVFLTFLLVGSTAFYQGANSYRVTMESRATIQDSLELFIRQKGRIPSSSKELLAHSRIPESLLEKSGNEPFAIKSSKSNSYTLIFAGRDMQLGSKDDDLYDEKISIREINETIFSEKGCSQ